MTARSIDGKAIAASIRADVAAAVAQLPGQPALAVVLVGDDPASHVYVSSKAKQTVEAGMRSVEVRLPADTEEADLIARVDALSRDPQIDGILVQLPLPKHINEVHVLAAIDPLKDIDGLTEASAGKLTGRTQEIQRLIGRSLRAVTNLPALGERQIVIDCDVIQADGGTRTASITGAWVALRDCLEWMRSRSIIKENPLRDHVAAISCGIFSATPVLDLDYAEDSIAETDANFVITGSGGLVEIQATAEVAVFSPDELTAMLTLAQKGVADLVALQKAALAS